MKRISRELCRTIEDAISALAPKPLGHINYEGIRYNALPLFGTIGEVWLLRPDGTLWRVDSDLGLEFEPLPESLHTMAYTAGIERYPWLSELIPERPPHARDCSFCAGSGRIAPSQGGGSASPLSSIMCYVCGALGWVVD